MIYPQGPEAEILRGKEKAEYIRNNPVEAGIVVEAEHFAWSSAHADPILRSDEE